MFGYIMVGTNDKERATTFFDGLMAALGHKRVFDLHHIVGWGRRLGEPWFAVCTPINRHDATVGNGSMVAFAVATEKDVDRLYKKAMKLGGICEGKPGVRPGGFYCAYFRDLDGNKFNFHTPGPEIRKGQAGQGD